jgi:hypothetical protein
MTIQLILGILFIHWFADFVMQTDWQARNKSKSLLPLLAHTTAYSVFWLWLGWEFAAITFVAHTATDYVTSRINSHLWNAQQVHWFFVSVGFDQFLHYTQLLLTYRYLNS